MIQDMPIWQNMVTIQKKMMNNQDLKKFLQIFLILDIGIVVFCLLQGNAIWLLNSQIAFVSSLLVTVGSFLGYQKNIESRVQHIPQEAQIQEDRDYIDRLEDPYDLDDEQDFKELSDEEIQQILKEEKQNQSRNSFKNTLFSMGGFASLYRIFGYVFLLIGFFYLVENKFFDVYSYLFGFLIVPIGALIVSIKKEK